MRKLRLEDLLETTEPGSKPRSSGIFPFCNFRMKTNWNLFTDPRTYLWFSAQGPLPNYINHAFFPVPWITNNKDSHQVSQKTKNRLPYDLAIPLLGTYLKFHFWNSTFGYISENNKHTKLKRYMHHNVCSSTIHNSQDMKQLKCPSSDEWIKKISFSATKRTKCLPVATIWMDLEIMLSEISQTEKDKYQLISCIRRI